MQTNLIKTIKEVRVFVPVEQLTKDMTSLEQYAKSVLNYTSKYNISFSISYAPENIIGKYVKYPSYGDFADTYILRSYGNWWKDSDAYQKEYMCQDTDPLGAEDYITLGFESAVVPRDVCIYETYNPGAVVRIWGRYTHGKWKLLWQGAPQVCPEESRKFHPEIRKLNCLVNEIRLEFNQSHLKYHTSIDAVLLGGYQPRNSYTLTNSVLREDLLNWGPYETSRDDDVAESCHADNGGGDDLFSRLPYEVILQIFQNLDLRSLSRCAQVNKSWHEATLEPILYQNLSLKKYWHKIDSDTLKYFKSRCRGVKKLDLSWCGEEGGEFAETFMQFYRKCCANLTHLSLCNCDFIKTKTLLSLVSRSCELTELRLKSIKIEPPDFSCLSQLTKLITLDLCSTNITDDALIQTLKANPNLHHIMLDFCENIENLDKVAETASLCNTNLTTWTSFKTTTLTSIGASYLARCTNLKELDLGWCFLLSHPGDCLERIATSCHNLRRLIVSQWRGINDNMLLPVILHCKNLRQLDLLGIKLITSDICREILAGLPLLRLLDISFCDGVDNELVEQWRCHYPNVVIQRSCQYVVMDFLN